MNEIQLYISFLYTPVAYDSIFQTELKSKGNFKIKIKYEILHALIRFFKPLDFFINKNTI